MSLYMRPNRKNARNFWLISFILILAWPVAMAISQYGDFSVLKGPYLGQKPPGMTPELFAPGLLSTGSHELDLTMTPDGKEIFFTRSGPDWFSAILHFKLVKEEWIGPLLPDFSEKYQNSYPFASPDGTKLFFNSTQPISVEENTKSDSFIFISEKHGDVWSRGKPISKEVIANHTESFTSVAANGNLYFGARYKEGHGGCDIYMCRYSGGAYQKAENLGEAVNSENDEFHCFISPDEEYLIFDARRPDGTGENDLYVSFKSESGTWSKAINLGKNINSKSSDSRPYVSPDGRYIFFSSNRVPEDNVDDVLTIERFQRRIEGPLNGFQDIYWVSAKVIDELRPKRTGGK